MKTFSGIFSSFALPSPLLFPVKAYPFDSREYPSK